MRATQPVHVQDVFTRFRAQILKETGISLSASKTSMIEQRLRNRVMRNARKLVMP